MKLTKGAFIKKASEEYGYESYKDLIKELGYGERYLDRFKYEDEINELFADKFSKWAGDKKPKSKVQSVKKVEVVDKGTGEISIKVKSVGETVTNKIYHSSDNLSASKIKTVLSNASEFKSSYITKDAKKSYSKALLIGSLHHTLVLEPEEFDNDYVVLGVDGVAVKADLVSMIEKLGGKIERVENAKGDMVVKETVKDLNAMLDILREKEKRTIVTASQLEVAKKTAKKALDSWYVIEDRGNTLLKAQLRDVLELPNSHVERTFYGEIDGVSVQVRPDLLMNLGKSSTAWFCVDLKTAEDATMEMFSKQSARFYYDLQEWIYCEILRQNGINVIDFRFCIAGKGDSSKSAYYKMDRDDIKDAEQIAKKAIQKYKFCKENDVWEESKFDFDKMRFEPCSTVRLPSYRKFMLIDLGIL